MNADNSDKRGVLIDLIEQEHLQQQHLDQAMQLAELTPTASQWQGFLRALVFWSGIIALSSGLIFFIAANWQEIGRMAKFVLVECAIIGAVVGYWCFQQNEKVKRACLLIAFLSVGALMALFGQTYQTGADPWQLFFNWALVTFPWVLVSRFNVLWLLWLGLLNLSVSLFYQAFGGYLDYTYGLFLLNSCALALWQFSAQKYAWLNSPWSIDLIGFASGYFATWIMVVGLFDDDPVGIVLWFIWAPLMLYVYRYRRLNVLMLSGLCLSAIIVLNCILVRVFPDKFEELLFFLLTAVTISAATFSTIWLKGLLEENNG